LKSQDQNGSGSNQSNLEETLQVLSAPGAASADVDAEVVATARRRTFTVEYKLSILRQAEGCTAPGELGALLRREGLYAARLSDWRKAREHGELSGGKARPRGPAPVAVTADSVELKRLRREHARLQARLERAELIIDIQKKVAALLGIPLQTVNDDGKN